MAIFGCILTDDCVQVGDRLRIWVDRNTVTPDEDPISMVEVDPDGSGTFYDVSDDLFLDWAFNADGIYQIKLQVTAGANVECFTREIEVKTEEDDCLFANDEDLRGFEPSIYDCLDCYRCSYKYIHRQVRECIMDCLLREGLLWDGCKPVDIKSYKSSEQLKKFATFWALEIIFNSFSKDPNDFWASRGAYYANLRKKSFNSYRIYFDEDGDGVVEQSEYLIRCNRLIRK